MILDLFTIPAVTAVYAGLLYVPDLADQEHVVLVWCFLSP
jgi:hypothetical protein